MVPPKGTVHRPRPFSRWSPTCLLEGGFGYDSTDMAAIRYRLKTLKSNWIIGITDAGQVKPVACFASDPKKVFRPQVLGARFALLQQPVQNGKQIPSIIPLRQEFVPCL